MKNFEVKINTPNDRAMRLLVLAEDEDGAKRAAREMIADWNPMLMATLHRRVAKAEVEEVVW